MRSGLFIRLSDCPKGGVLTLWHKDKMLKRIEPSSRYIKIPLKEIRIGLPERKRILSVCFHAPGHRFRQVAVRF